MPLSLPFVFICVGIPLLALMYWLLERLLVRWLGVLSAREWQLVVKLGCIVVLALVLLVRLVYVDSPPELQIYGRF